MSTSTIGPHQGQPIMSSGVALNAALAAVILVHGRGASADSILPLAAEFHAPGVIYLAPQAANDSWYPYRFMEPVEKNEPWLSSALLLIEELLSHLGEKGIPAHKTILLGFSQGACLVLEYAARHARRYGGVIGLSGGLIGPDNMPRNYAGSLAGTPVFLGCSDIDFHIPAARIRYTADVLRQLGGNVTMRLYPGLGHTINQDEIEAAQEIISTVIDASISTANTDFSQGT